MTERPSAAERLPSPAALLEALRPLAAELVAEELERVDVGREREAASAPNETVAEYARRYRSTPAAGRWPDERSQGLAASNPPAGEPDAERGAR